MSTASILSEDAPRIWWIGGSKGGVGKSMTTLAVVDHFLEAGRNGHPRRAPERPTRTSEK